MKKTEYDQVSLETRLVLDVLYSVLAELKQIRSSIQGEMQEDI